MLFAEAPRMAIGEEPLETLLAASPLIRSRASSSSALWEDGISSTSPPVA